MKQWLKGLCLLLSLLALAGCSRQPKAAELAGKTYCYEKGGFGGDFTITLDQDGSFTYYEGSLSSYIGAGEWSLEGDTLTLQEKDRHFCFRVEGDDLIFREEDSGEFTYLTPSDGEKFTATE